MTGTGAFGAGAGRGRRVGDVRVEALRPGRRLQLPDAVAAEEPLEIRVAPAGADPQVLGVTMRTPGHDFELAVGFLLSEGVVRHPATVRAVRFCTLGAEEEQRYNVVTVDLGAPADTSPAGTSPAAAQAVAVRPRRFPISSACGVCGTATLDDLQRRCAALPPGPELAATTLVDLPEQLRASQKVFERTGGLHAAGLFDVDGKLLAAREDVGRHNAVDKLVGWAALRGALPLHQAVLVVSGRLGFEIVQKAAVAGIAIVVAVSAPSSLAVDTARRFNMTLAAFVRDGRANLYSGAQRVVGQPRAAVSPAAPSAG